MVLYELGWVCVVSLAVAVTIVVHDSRHITVLVIIYSVSCTLCVIIFLYFDEYSVSTWWNQYALAFS